MDLKRPLSFIAQVERLKQHNMIVDNDASAAETLARLSYYRFSGFALQYRLSENNSDFVDGTRFDDVLRIAHFDMDLRCVLRRYIEIAEIYYRTQISYGFALAKCLTPPHDQHYYECNYFNKKGFNEVLRDFRKQKKYYQDSLIVRHHKQKYGGKLPLWVIVEMISLSDLSKLYSAMYDSEQDAIAANVGTGRTVLKNHLHCLAVLRNKCAHASRLYNSAYRPPVQFSSNYYRSHPEMRNDTLFAYILMLVNRLPEAYRTSCTEDIMNIINEYKDVLQLDLMGFPENYKEYFS